MAEFHCGATFGFYAPAGYFASQTAREEIDEMARTGIKWVVLVPTVWQDAYCSTRQYADFAKTPDDLEIADIIGYIHSKGMRVQLRPMLECQDGTGRLGVIVGDDRERMVGHERNYCRKWFASMTARSVHYARIAERTKCELYCLDSELDRFIGKNKEWKAVVAAVRAVYSGPVTSCHTIHTKVIDFEKELSDKAHWLYDLDFLSLSDFVRAAPRGRDDLSVEQLMENMNQERDRIRRIAALYGKPILFGECGCPSWKSGSGQGGNVREPDKYPYAGEEQARYMEAFFRVFGEEPWCLGFYWWKWDDHSPRVADDPDPLRGFTVRGKPAQAVMKAWYSAKNAKMP